MDFIKMTNNRFLDNILPIYGNARKAMPAYDDSQRAFICDQHESEKGHLYYKALRFSNRISIVEKVALAYNCTYLNSIEIYAFNGLKFELIQKKDFESATFHCEKLVKEESKRMLQAYLSSMSKIGGVEMSEEQIAEKSDILVEESYKSLLGEDSDIRLTRILPAIGQ